MKDYSGARRGERGGKGPLGSHIAVHEKGGGGGPMGPSFRKGKPKEVGSAEKKRKERTKLRGKPRKRSSSILRRRKAA